MPHADANLEFIGDFIRFAIRRDGIGETGISLGGLAVFDDDNFQGRGLLVAIRFCGRGRIRGEKSRGRSGQRSEREERGECERFFHGFTFDVDVRV